MDFVAFAWVHAVHGVQRRDRVRAWSDAAGFDGGVERAGVDQIVRTEDELAAAAGRLMPSPCAAE